MHNTSRNALTALALAGTLLAAPAFAEQAHHPDGAATPATPAGQGMGMMGGMDMGQMHEMMQRMHAAKTPEQRQAIRAEHHKAMQARIGMMRQGMHNSQCPMAKDDAAQQQCLKTMGDNMQDMLQMMEQMLDSQSMANGQ